MTHDDELTSHNVMLSKKQATTIRDYIGTNSLNGGYQDFKKMSKVESSQHTYKMSATPGYLILCLRIKNLPFTTMPKKLALQL